MSRLRSFLFTSYGEPRLLFPGLAMLVVAFLLGLVVTLTASRVSGHTEEERAASLLRSGKAAQAEAIYARLVREHPTVPLVLALFEAHEVAKLHKERAAAGKDKREQGDSMGLPDKDGPMPEDELEKIVDGLPEDVSVIARFSRPDGDRELVRELRPKIEAGATREPPMPWANHLLGLEALHDDKYAEAATFYLREGLAFRERSADVDRALAIWMKLEAWEEVRDRMQDARIASVITPETKYEWAVHERDWVSASRVLPSLWKPRITLAGLGMTAVTALAWAFFCARLGKLGGRPKVRLPLYAIAFVLGVCSVVPTVVLIAIEEAKLRLVATGDPARDLLFFVFGVGLREEASKLLLFLPLLPALRRWGDKLDVLVCGAMVGLGFAAEENLGYLASENLHTGLARFLTANFFHMAMTGILASAVDDFVSDREKYAQDFTRATLLVVGMHGAYDFLLSHPEYGGMYIAMTVFILLTKLFLSSVDAARRRADRGIAPVHAFVIATAVVTGVSLAHAFVAVGPQYAAAVMVEGLIGEAIIVFVFVRTLRTM